MMYLNNLKFYYIRYFQHDYFFIQYCLYNNNYDKISSNSSIHVISFYHARFDGVGTKIQSRFKFEKKL